MAEYTSRKEVKGRTILADVVPLNTPYVFGIFLGDICNFRCKYCIQSMRGQVMKDKEGNTINHELIEKFLSWDDFLLIADQLQKFPKKIKKILFSSMGEPLLHKRLADMIAYLHDRDVAKSYEIISNASMLTPELSKRLIDAGLSRFCVSIQGVNKQKYKEICGYDIDFDKLLQNLSFFYKYSRGKCKVHIKTVDAALDVGDKDRFFEIFSPMCDTIYIDHVIEAFEGVGITSLKTSDKQQIYEMEQQHIDVCSALFYTLYVLANGEIVPCCKTPYPMHYGNIHHRTLCEAWNSRERYNFLMLHLKKKRNEHRVCRNCVAPQATEFKEDLLDEAAEEIMNRL